MSDLVFCSKCCMDGSCLEIVLDDQGVCNFCRQAQKALAEDKLERVNLQARIEQIKRDGEGKLYDVILGLSGGVDSSTVLHEAHKLGLRIFAFSMDNGYNRPESDENVLKMVEKLKVPFYRFVIDLERYRELQQAFLIAGIKNLEAVTDHILFASTYEMANRYGIKWILSGGNTATESIMPPSWGEDARDLYWIKGIYKSVTGKNLKGLPTISFLREQYLRLVKQIKFFRLLDFLDYNREEAIQTLEKEYGYRSYGEKHCENVWTWWYQNFYLFEKWGIDKRKAHYASLINSGQMTRKEAMDLLLQSPVYPTLGFEDKVLRYPLDTGHPSSQWFRQKVARIYKFIPKKWKS